MSELTELFRNAIDLNRYSNSVSLRLVRAWNDAVLDVVEQLQLLDALDQSAKATRLRSVLAQLKESLDTWAGSSTLAMQQELQGLAVLQGEFATRQLQRALPAGRADIVRTVEISPTLAQAIVTAEPTAAGVVNLSDSLVRMSTQPVTFQLTLGQQLTLPNGQTIKQSFSSMSARQVDIFSLTVRNGIIQGESIDAITRRVRGRLQRDQAGSIDSIIARGGQATAIPNNQIRAIVRTSVNQVASTSDQLIAVQNPELTKHYIYTATLDTKTSDICRALDGKMFRHQEGPVPPQHYQCRSRIRNVPRGLEKEFSEIRETYGEWLNDQDDDIKRDVLGPERLQMWNGLVRKYGPTNAIRKFVAQDGSTLSLDQLKSRGYGSSSK